MKPSQNRRVARWRNVLPRENVRGVGGYSRFVMLMRWSLPAAAAVLAILILIWPSFKADLVDLPSAAIGPREMLNPRYSGSSAHGEPFTVRAARAVQPGADMDVIDLLTLNAEMKGAEGVWTRLSADKGHYDRKKNTLDLTGAVHVTNHQGYDVITDVAHVFLKEGRAVGDKPVVGKGPMGKINALGFRVEDNGRTIIFTGRPKLDLEGKKKP